MKTGLLSGTVIAAMLLGAGVATAQMGDGHRQGMMQDVPQQEMGTGYHQGGYPAHNYGTMDDCTAMGRYGMNPKMMGYYGMGPGMMSGFGRGNMMSGAMAGCGMGNLLPSFESSEKMNRFFNETKEERKKLHDLRFEYGEKMRDPQTTIGDLQKMKEEMANLRKTIMDKNGR